VEIFVLLFIVVVVVAVLLPPLDVVFAVQGMMVRVRILLLIVWFVWVQSPSMVMVGEVMLSW